MSLLEFPGHSNSPEQTGEQVMPSVEQVPESITPLHPFETREGVVLLEQASLPRFDDIEIDRVTTRRQKSMDTDHGKYYERKQIFSDGTKRIEYIGVADNPVSTVPMVKKPAWVTSASKGFNKRTADRFLAIGRNVIIEGIANNRAHSLYRNAWDTHLALDYASVEFYGIIGTSEIDVEGDSNGAMEGTGVMAYAPYFDRHVRDAYLVDPCIVHKIGALDVGKFLRHPDYFAREIYCLGKQAVRLARDEEENIRDYAKTLELTPEFVIGNLLLSRGLFWGEFGHVLSHVPEDQRAHYVLFEYSIANQKQAFQRILRGASGLARQGITTQTLIGTHMSIANPKTRQSKIDYFTA